MHRASDPAERIEAEAWGCHGAEVAAYRESTRACHGLPKIVGQVDFSTADDCCGAKGQRRRRTVVSLPWYPRAWSASGIAIREIRFPLRDLQASLKLTCANVCWEPFPIR